MKIERESLNPIEFGGLEIRDYTVALDESSSIAEIIVPAAARHEQAWSKRSDKYYYVIDGSISFIVDDQVVELSTGDVCIIRRGERFSYENTTGVTAKVLLVHTPNFNLSEEVFDNQESV
jgi:mannose-6-phosphate isomerase-like protein (cupin superfamily)